MLTTAEAGDTPVWLRVDSYAVVQAMLLAAAFMLSRRMHMSMMGD